MGVIEYHLCEIDQCDGKRDYVNRAISNIDKADFVLVDGRLRSACVSAAINRIKGGGLLIIDNIDRYIPTNVNTPLRRASYSSDEWRLVHEQLKWWRCFIFDNGVWATGIWVKPCDKEE